MECGLDIADALATLEITAGFVALLDARCVIEQNRLQRSKAFYEWRRRTAQPLASPKGATFATVSEAGEDNETPRKRRCAPRRAPRVPS